MARALNVRGRTEEKVVNAVWWTADENSTSLTSCAYTAPSLWNEWCRKMIAAKPIITGVTTTMLMTP